MPARILVIEDNLANLDLVRYLLEFRGHEVLDAGDGECGVIVARKKLPDLVICDLQIPRLDGYGVIAQLRAAPETAGLVVVALTAFSMPRDRDKVLNAGFDGYFSKPLDAETFIGRVEAYLAPELRTTNSPPKG
jgi:CheY-like chemotaxis protein